MKSDFSVLFVVNLTLSSLLPEIRGDAFPNRSCPRFLLRRKPKLATRVHPSNPLAHSSEYQKRRRRRRQNRSRSHENLSNVKLARPPFRLFGPAYLVQVICHAFSYIFLASIESEAACFLASNGINLFFPKHHSPLGMCSLPNPASYFFTGELCRYKFSLSIL